MFVFLLACSPGPDLMRQGMLLGKVSGVALNPEGWTGGRVGMFSTTCDVTRSGDLGSEYDFVHGEEEVTDTDGLHVVVVTQDRVLVQTDEGWFGPVFDEHRVPGVRDAQWIDGELLALSGDSSCTLEWVEEGASLDVPCGELLQGAEGALIRTDEELISISEGPVLGASVAAVWDTHHERYLQADAGSVQAVDLAGQTLWSVEPGGTVRDIAATPAGALIAVEYEDGSGGLILAEGEVLDTQTTRWAGHSLEVSGDGLNVALLRDSSVVFYELWP